MFLYSMQLFNVDCISLLSLLCSEYSVHYTRIKPNSFGHPQCNVRAKDQYVGAIPDLGTEEMRIMYSQGFITGDE